MCFLIKNERGLCKVHYLLFINKCRHQKNFYNKVHNSVELTKIGSIILLPKMHYINCSQEKPSTDLKHEILL